MIIAVLIVLGIAVALGVAWGWSGRSRGAEHNPLAAAERADAQAKAAKQYRPNGGNPPGPVM